MALTPTIAQQRDRWNAAPGHPAIRLRSQWGARRSYTDDNPVTHPATRVFCHISVTSPANYKGNDAHAQAIENIGISRFPNTGISYNFGIMPNGSLYEFQPVGRRGAHTVNDDRRRTCTKYGSQCPGYQSGLTATDSSGWNLNYNARSFVFCAIESTPVTTAVIEMFARAIYTAYKAGFITKDAAQNIHGHRCVSSKGCPGAKMWAVMKTIQSKINQLIAGGVQEDDMFTDADRALLQRLNQVITSNSDEKVDRPDATTTAGMKFALEKVWADTHSLTAKTAWQSPGVSKYVAEVVGWKDSSDPTRGAPVTDRYILEATFSYVHRMNVAQDIAFKAVNATLAEVLGASSDNNLDIEQWKTLLDERLRAAFEENVLQVKIDFAHDAAEEPPPLDTTT
jgi:hypothetical protein